MSDLQNLTPANTYKGLLQIGDYTDGISGDTGGNALQVTDGAGNNTALAISTDRVGIGTTSPSKELDVNGNVVADEYALDATGSSSSAVAIHAPATNELAIRTNSTEAMRIDSNGNVGIGTASPDEMLHLEGAEPVIKLTDTTTNLSASLDANNTRGSLLCIADSTNDGTDAFISFRIGGRAIEYQKMIIDSDGNVGIGTTNPSAPLHLLTSGTDGTLVIESDDAGSDYAPDLLLFRSSTTPAVNDNLGEIKFRGKNDDDPQGNIDYTMIRSRIKDPTNNSEKGELTFWTRSGTTLYQRMTIDPDGNVGIGTESPATPLEIQFTDATAYAEDESGNAFRARNISQAADTFSCLELFAGQTSAGGVNIARIFAIKESTTTTATSLAFTTRASDEVVSEAMRIDSDGNVGIGTMTPSAPLEVSSTTGGVIMPRMNTSQRTAISASNGEMVYDTDLHKFYGYANGAWVALH